MPKSVHRRKLLHPKLLIPVILLIVIIIGGYYLKTRHSDLNIASKYCPKITDFYTVIKSTWPNVNINVRDIDPSTPEATGSPNLYFTWRTGTDTPFFGFNAQRTLIFDLPNQQFDSTNHVFQTKIIPELKNQAFSIDPNNTLDTFESNTISKTALYGMSQDNQKFAVIFAASEDSSYISVTCGIIDPVYMTIYSRMEKAKKHTNTQRVEIWDITDNLARVNIANIYGFGSAEYWDLSQNSPELLISNSQEQPPCNLLESRKIGKGTDCWDPGADHTRPANY